MKQATAARRMIKTLDLKPGYGALVQMFLGLAEAVDRESDSAALWREYAHAETTLREATQDSGDDELQFLRSIRTPRVSSKMGNS